MPIRVNAYHFVAAFAAGERDWWVLSDGNCAIVVRPEDAFLIDEEKQLYSVRYLKDAIMDSFCTDGVEAIIMSKFITIYRRNGKSGKNKKNDVKI